MKKGNKFNNVSNLGKYQKPFLNEFANTDLTIDQTKGNVDSLSIDQNLTSERDVDLLERTIDTDTETPLLTPGKTQK